MTHPFHPLHGREFELIESSFAPEPVISFTGMRTLPMIDTARALALAKAARVLLDEAEMIGLGYSIDVKATQGVSTTGDG